MTVSELIKLLQTLENPESARIVVNDLAGRQRDIDLIENVLDHNAMYVIETKKLK